MTVRSASQPRTGTHSRAEPMAEDETMVRLWLTPEQVEHIVAMREQHHSHVQLTVRIDRPDDYHTVECHVAAAPQPMRQKPMHKACRCVRPVGHDGLCNCQFRDGPPWLNCPGSGRPATHVGVHYWGGDAVSAWQCPVCGGEPGVLDNESAILVSHKPRDASDALR